MLGVHLTIGDYRKRLHVELDRVDLAEAVQLSDLIHQAWRDGRAVFVIGNGGSATNASHICEDLAKCTLRQADMTADPSPRRLKIQSLTDNVGWITAIGNDIGYEQIYVQQLMNLAGPGDLLIAISGSGNSPNILAAADWAKRHGLTTFGLTGFNGGKLKAMQDAGIHVPMDDMGMVESIHMCLLHWVVDDLFGRFNGEGRYTGHQ